MGTTVHLVLAFYFFANKVKALQNFLEILIIDLIYLKMVLFLLTIVLSFIMQYFLKGYVLLYIEDIWNISHYFIFVALSLFFSRALFFKRSS